MIRCDRVGRPPMPSSGFWIVILEAALALALLVFIVWWTLPKKRGGKDESRER